MRLSRRLTGLTAAALVAASTTVASAPPSSAASLTCGTGAAVDHSVGSAQTFVTCNIIKTYPSGTPTAAAPTFVNWTPPVCWLEPQWDGAGLKGLITGEMATVGAADPAMGAYLKQLDTMYNSITPNAYHMNENGMWWSVGCRIDDFTYTSVYPAQMAADGLSGNNPWVWIPAGAQPTQPNPVTPLILAQYAAAELVPPALTFSVNPGAVQTVNLSTRVFANQPVGTYQDIQAQALIGGMTSTVDAVPSSVTIKPGGPASQTVGGPPVTSITCPITNGSFGSATNDSCAFYYTKATPAGTSYPLTASITWTYTWLESPNAAGWPVTVTVAAAPQNVTVQEVQAIVGGH